MDFKHLDELIPVGELQDGRSRWPSATGNPHTEWGPEPIEWAAFDTTQPFRWVEVESAAGSRVRVTDGGSRSAGDFLIFAEVLVPGTTITAYWRPMTYLEVSWDLHRKASTTGANRRHMRGEFLPSAVALALGQASMGRAVANLGRRDRSKLDQLGSSRRQLLAALLAASLEEDRNYPDSWKRGGGRYLPVRLAAAVVWGCLPPDRFHQLGAFAASRGTNAAAVIADSAPPSLREILPSALLPTAHAAATRREFFAGKRRRL